MRDSWPGWAKRTQALLWWVGGAHPRLLADESCWLERPRYTANGLAVLVTVAAATISASATIASVVPSRSSFFHAAGGMMWGSAILILDRLLLLNLFKLESGRLGISAWSIWVRIAGAVLIALTVSQTVELAVFERLLNMQIAVKHERDVSAQSAQIDARYKEIPLLVAERSQLAAEVRAKAGEADAASAAAACEADGTCGSGNRGANAIYEIKRARASDLARAAIDIRGRNADRIHDIDVRLGTLKAAREHELTSFQQIASAADDFLARRVALAELKSDPVYGFEVWVTSWVLTLLALFFELAPLVTKLTAAYGAYDAAYLAIQDSKATAWRAEGERVTRRISVETEQEAMLNAAVLTAFETILVDATSGALTSKKSRRARSRLGDEILDRSVRVARKAAASVFDDWLQDDVVASARARRRQADDELVENEFRKASAFRAVDDAVRDAAEDLREPDAPLH